MEAKASKISLDPGYIKSESEGTPSKTNTEYQKLIGKMLYIAVKTRPTFLPWNPFAAILARELAVWCVPERYGRLPITIEQKK